MELQVHKFQHREMMEFPHPHRDPFSNEAYDFDETSQDTSTFPSSHSISSGSGGFPIQIQTEHLPPMGAIRIQDLRPLASSPVQLVQSRNLSLAVNNNSQRRSSYPIEFDFERRNGLHPTQIRQLNEIIGQLRNIQITTTRPNCRNIILTVLLCMGITAIYLLVLILVYRIAKTENIN